MSEAAGKVVRATRAATALLLALPLALVVLLPASHADSIPDTALALVSLAGLLAPVIALHRYRAAEPVILAAEGELARASILRRVTLSWLCVSGVVALAGAVLYLRSGDPRACAGSVLHLFVGAAFWPTAARVERLVDRAID